MTNKPGNDKASAVPSPLAPLIADLLNTAEFRRFIAEVGEVWVGQWSGDSRIRKGAGKPLIRIVKAVIADSGHQNLKAVFGNPENVRVLLAELPMLLTEAGGILKAMIHGFEILPADDKKILLSRLFESESPGFSGRIISSFSRIAEEIYADDPEFFSSRSIPRLRRLIEDIDFGSVKHLAEIGRGDLDAFIRDAVGVVFDYPAKLVVLLSFIPDGINLVLSALSHLLGHVNALPPDIFTDILLSLFKGVDGPAIGRILNQVNETIRQVHTGSTLIGDMDAPRFTGDLKKTLRDIMAEIDPALIIKARNALIDGEETLAGVLVETAEEHPELLNLWLSQLAARRNSRIRLFRRKVQVIENLPEEDAMEALSAGLSRWNAYDLAEAVNTVCRMMNRMHGMNPGVIKGLVTEFVNSLSPVDLEDSLDWLVRDLGQAVRPLFRTVAPSVIREFCGFFSHGDVDDGCDASMDEARELLRRLFEPSPTDRKDPR